MLPPFIIEQIRKREELERQRQREAVIQLPLPDASRIRRPAESRNEPREERGVVIIDLTGS